MNADKSQFIDCALDHVDALNNGFVFFGSKGK